MSLTGKVALITGASKGIGKAIALKLSSIGATVVINYSRDPAPANELVTTIGTEKAFAIKADVSSVESCRALIKATVEKFGKIDILVNNAGILPMKTLEATTEEDFDSTFNLNVKGPYFLTQEAAKHLTTGGRVIFISSSLTVASSVSPGYLLYNSTKGSIEQMTRIIAKELAPKGITVNCVSPGPTGTELFFNGKSEQVVKMIEGMSPANRLGKPEEIANSVAFLVGEDASWVNGQNLRVNGAMV